MPDAARRPIQMTLSAGHASDYVGARVLVDRLPKAGTLLADRGYDADWFRKAVKDMGIVACIPFQKGLKTPIPHDTALYKRRNQIENTFARLKDWRRIATRYNRCPKVFLYTCALAAIVIFWL